MRKGKYYEKNLRKISGGIIFSILIICISITVFAFKNEYRSTYNFDSALYSTTFSVKANGRVWVKLSPKKTESIPTIQMELERESWYGWKKVGDKKTVRTLDKSVSEFKADKSGTYRINFSNVYANPAKGNVKITFEN